MIHGMRLPRRARLPLLLLVPALALTGCGLAAELEREADPARTSRPPSPEPSPTPPVPETAPPAPEAPPADDPGAAEDCPASGFRARAAATDAAMGLRVGNVIVFNCGTETLKLKGYPVLQVLDREREPMETEVVEGTRRISMGPEDPGPSPLVLEPGMSARSTLAWRYWAVDPHTGNGLGAYLRVAPDGETKPQTVEVADGGLDVGEGVLGTTAWQYDISEAPPERS
ncbi:DUF4232 domain-containing protein [Streptomyces koyangensis]|uniref:DUF4232 domain-containing protein n=2 Tax=Streptomyces koyangensis TaxID=188770 RepID=A0ABX7EM34_9ACTN|nr:DUF4232 domain-containing protein [Streptomyces koyangensis]